MSTQLWRERVALRPWVAQGEKGPPLVCPSPPAGTLLTGGAGGVGAVAGSTTGGWGW